MIFHPNIHKRLVCVRLGNGDVEIDFPENLGNSETDFSENSEIDFSQNLGKSEIDFPRNLGVPKNES